MSDIDPPSHQNTLLRNIRADNVFNTIRVFYCIDNKTTRVDYPQLCWSSTQRTLVFIHFLTWPFTGLWELQPEKHPLLLVENNSSRFLHLLVPPCKLKVRLTNPLFCFQSLLCIVDYALVVLQGWQRLYLSSVFNENLTPLNCCSFGDLRFCLLSILFQTWHVAF